MQGEEEEEHSQLPPTVPKILKNRARPERAAAPKSMAGVEEDEDDPKDIECSEDDSVEDSTYRPRKESEEPSSESVGSENDEEATDQDTPSRRARSKSHLSEQPLGKATGNTQESSRKRARTKAGLTEQEKVSFSIVMSLQGYFHKISIYSMIQTTRR